jgi:hypothetical protein
LLEKATLGDKARPVTVASTFCRPQLIPAVILRVSSASRIWHARDRFDPGKPLAEQPIGVI